MPAPLRRVLPCPVATNPGPIQDALDPAPDPRPGLGLFTPQRLQNAHHLCHADVGDRQLADDGRRKRRE